MISSPYYPKDNATTEATVKIAKYLMRKAHKSKSDVYFTLVAHRNTLKPGIRLSLVHTTVPHETCENLRAYHKQAVTAKDNQTSSETAVTGGLGEAALWH